MRVDARQGAEPKRAGVAEEAAERGPLGPKEGALDELVEARRVATEPLEAVRLTLAERIRDGAS
jgi:hypothetical protein